MTKEFDAEPTSLGDIFGTSDSFYKIPNYQRPYSWGNEEVKILWEDLWTAFTNNKENPEMDKNYFLGGMVLTPSDKVDYLDVVDGQQRLTTLMILFCVFRDYGALEENYKTVIENKIKDHKNYGRLKLLTEVGKRNEFEIQILNEIKLNLDEEKEERKNKYLNTTYIFKEEIETLKKNKEEIEKFIDYLLEKVKIIKIICTSKAFAIKLFQIINTRGLDLSETDLIKSFLLYKLEKNKHEQFISDWAEIEKSIKGITNIDNLFIAFEYYLLEKNPRKTLSEEIENEFKNKYNDSNEFIFDLKKFTEKYLDICEDKLNFPFRYLRHQGYWQPILTSAKLTMNDGDYESLSKLLKQFYYLYWIAGYTTAKIKQTSFNIIGWIKGGQNISEIQKKLREKITEDKVIKGCEDTLFDENVYGERWVKPLLLLIEYNQTEGNTTDYIAIEPKTHIEHILPQDAEYHHTYQFEEKHQNYIDKLPNLTLLSGRKNIQASNNPFSEKKKCYRGKGIEGETGFRITQKIIDECDEWNSEEFQKRKVFLKQEINKLLLNDFK